MKYSSIKLSDIAIKITKGTTPTTIGSVYTTKGVKFIKSESIVSSRELDRTKFTYIDSATHEKLKRSQIIPNDILFSIAGVYLGKTAIATIEDTPANTNQAVAIIRIDPNLADYEYVYYWINLPEVREFINSSVAQSAQPNFNLKQIGNLEIDLPSQQVQFEVSRILSALDAQISLNKQINHHLAEIAKATFKSWFVDFDPWDSKQPSDWLVVEFSKFLTPRNEKSNNPNIPLYSVTDTGIYPRSDKFNKNLSKADTKNKIIRYTDLVFGMSREILNWGIMRSPIGAVSSAYNVFEVNSVINSKYLESYIKAQTQYFKDLIRPATREGQGVDKGALMLKTIYLPPKYVLDEYYEFEDALNAKILKNEYESARLADLRDTLLPRLMSGEISVANI